MTNRKEFRKRDIIARFTATGGVCELCSVKLKGGDYHADHIIPDAMGGSNDSANMQLLCLPCHAEKTKCDVANVAKAVRREWKAKGTARKPKRERASMGKILPRRPIYTDIK